MNSKGQLRGILIAMVVLIAIILFFFIWGLFAPPIVNIIQTSSNVISGAVAGSGNLNLSTAVNSSIVPAAAALGNVQWISYGILIFLIIGFFIMVYFVRDYPFLIVIWIVFIIIMSFTSIYLSNAYNHVSSGNGEIAVLYRSWALNHFFLSNLPIITVMTGIFGGIIMLVSATRDSEQEASIM